MLLTKKRYRSVRKEGVPGYHNSRKEQRILNTFLREVQFTWKNCNMAISLIKEINKNDLAGA